MKIMFSIAILDKKIDGNLIEIRNDVVKDEALLCVNFLLFLKKKIDVQNVLLIYI
jgi:hypothetical protein